MPRNSESKPVTSPKRQLTAGLAAVMTTDGDVDVGEPQPWMCAFGRFGPTETPKNGPNTLTDPLISCPGMALVG